MPTLRTVLFRLHWAFGLTAGLVLAVMGVTGAMMSYEDAFMASANRDLAFVPVRSESTLAPEALVARAARHAPGVRIGSLLLSSEPGASVRIRFAIEKRTGVRPPSFYLDPYDGTVLGTARLEGTFATVRALHRWLLIPGEARGWGRTVTGACALALLVFLGTGFYLRWPQVHRWRTWLRPSLSRPGRARWWSVHAVLGTWLMPVYLMIALSGLTWSYGWFKDGATFVLTGGDALTRSRRGLADNGAGLGVDGGSALDRAWAAFSVGEGREAGSANVILPSPENGMIRIR